MNAVLRFRLEWMEDRTPLDLCPLYAQAGRTIIDSIEPELRTFVVEPTDGPCVHGPSTGPQLKQVRVQSVVQNDSMAQVRVSVLKGDHHHLEDYTVKRLSLLRPGVWDVMDVRIWGRMYVVPPRDPRR